jgi:hypothetical protein
MPDPGASSAAPPLHRVAPDHPAGLDLMLPETDHHGATGSADPTVPHRGDRERVLPPQARQRHRDVARQVARASQTLTLGTQAITAAGDDLSNYLAQIDPPRIQRLARRPTTEIRYTYPQPPALRTALDLSIFNRYGSSKCYRRGQLGCRCRKQSCGNDPAGSFQHHLIFFLKYKV